jgi:hypothetical protein
MRFSKSNYLKDSLVRMLWTLGCQEGWIIITEMNFWWFLKLALAPLFLDLNFKFF